MNKMNKMNKIENYIEFISPEIIELGLCYKKHITDNSYILSIKRNKNKQFKLRPIKDNILCLRDYANYNNEYYIKYKLYYSNVNKPDTFTTFPYFNYKQITKFQIIFNKKKSR